MTSTSSGQVTIAPQFGTFGVIGSPLTTSQAEENFLVVVTSAGSDASNSTHTAVTTGQYLNFANTDYEGRSITTTSTEAIIQCKTTAAIDVAVTYTATLRSAGNIRTKGIGR